MVVIVKKLIKNAGEKSFTYLKLNAKKVQNASKNSIIYPHAQMLI